jgi:DNA repair protein RadC
MTNDNDSSTLPLNITLIREIRVSYVPNSQPMFQLTHPEQVASIVRSVLIDNSREHTVALYLDGANQLVAYSVVSIGTAVSAPVHPREVFQPAVLCGAVSLVFAHNHPSGKMDVSKDDVRITRCLKATGKLLCIRLLDHVIVTDTRHYSLFGTHHWPR